VAEEIDWSKVAKELVKTLGTETARGLYYAFIAQIVYPRLADIIGKLIRGEPLTMDEKQLLKQKLEVLAQKAGKETIATDTLEQQLARELARYYSIQQKVPATPEVKKLDSIRIDTEVNLLQKELQELEKIKAQLTARLRSATSEEEKTKIQLKIKELEERVSENKLKLKRLAKLKQI